MILTPPPANVPRDKAGCIIYPIDNGEPLANDTEHLEWINYLKYGLEDWFADREDVFIAADLLWYPVEGRPDLCKAPDVMVVMNHHPGQRWSYKQWEEEGKGPQVVFEFISRSNTATELLEKQAFYMGFGVQEYFVYDYHKGLFNQYKWDTQSIQSVIVNPREDGTWRSEWLDLTFALDAEGVLSFRRGDGQLMERHAEMRARAERLTKRAEAEAKRAEAYAKKLRDLGIDPASLA